MPSRRFVLLCQKGNTGGGAGRHPYNLSVDPDNKSTKGALPNAANYFVYHKLGNTGFIGYSGAHDAAGQEALFKESCSYFELDPKPDVIFLVGHWSSAALGYESYG